MSAADDDAISSGVRGRSLAGPAAIAVAPPGAITISKSVDDASNNGSVEPGESLTYTITLANSGGAVTGFGVTDPLDPNLVFVSADNGGVYAGNSVTWSNLAIPANGSLTTKRAPDNRSSRDSTAIVP